MAAPEEFWLEFIQIYRENPCLWDGSCVDFHNSSKKNLAYGMLIEKLWEINESADLETVKRKISSFRSSLRRELDRKAKSKQEGKDHKPIWCYYNAFSFLLPSQGQGLSNEEYGTIEIESDEINSNFEPPEPSSSNISTTSITDDKLHTATEAIAKVTNSGSQSKRRKIGPTNSKTASIEEPIEADSEDDCSTFAAHLKTRMRSFDPQQKCIAQKLISDVMFMAEMKQLRLTSAIVIQPKPGNQEDDANSDENTVLFID